MLQKSTTSPERRYYLVSAWYSTKYVLCQSRWCHDIFSLILLSVHFVWYQIVLSSNYLGELLHYVALLIILLSYHQQTPCVYSFDNNVHKQYNKMNKSLRKYIPFSCRSQTQTCVLTFMRKAWDCGVTCFSKLSN